MNKDQAGEGPALEIEITQAMIAAGLSELSDLQFGQPLREIVEAVYLAMEIERLASSQ